MLVTRVEGTAPMLVDTHYFYTLNPRLATTAARSSGRGDKNVVSATRGEWQGLTLWSTRSARKMTIAPHRGATSHQQPAASSRRSSSPPAQPLA